MDTLILVCQAVKETSILTGVLMPDMIGASLSHDILKESTMGARYLLIEFDDEAPANRLREQIDAATRKGKKYRVVGLFARPKSFCRCGTWETERNAKSTLKRGAKFGWSVCTVCKKPAPTMGFLRNLISNQEILDPVIDDVYNDKAKTHRRYSWWTPGLGAIGYTSDPKKELH